MGLDRILDGIVMALLTFIGASAVYQSGKDNDEKTTEMIFIYVFLAGLALFIINYIYKARTGLASQMDKVLYGGALVMGLTGFIFIFNTDDVSHDMDKSNYSTFLFFTFVTAGYFYHQSGLKACAYASKSI